MVLLDSDGDVITYRLLMSSLLYVPVEPGFF
jgi:hypothetical protein